MRIGLFSLCGFGNRVLRALDTVGLRPDYVVTRKETGPFPYYPEDRIEETAGALSVPVLYDGAGEEHAANHPVDMLISATYHRILTDRVINSANLAVNIHPSLLPAHRGPNPIYWAIREGLRETGITIHRLERQADTGDILWAARLPLGGDETQGSLRKRLAELAAAELPAFLTAASSGGLQAAPQDETLASYRPRLADADLILETSLTLVEFGRRLRAASPFPGARLKQWRLTGLDESSFHCSAPPGSIEERDGQLCVHLLDGWVMARLG